MVALGTEDHGVALCTAEGVNLKVSSASRSLCVCDPGAVSNNWKPWPVFFTWDAEVPECVSVASKAVITTTPSVGCKEVS